jgi:hypothetical protein
VTDAYELHLMLRLHQTDVPETLHYGLIQYIGARRPVGSFLTAVLENDLRQAVSRADFTNRERLHAIVIFLYNFAPGECWGSPAAVARWLTDSEPPPEVFE